MFFVSKSECKVNLFLLLSSENYFTKNIENFAFFFEVNYKYIFLKHLCNLGNFFLLSTDFLTMTSDIYDSHVNCATYLIFFFDIQLTNFNEFLVCKFSSLPGSFVESSSKDISKSCFFL